MKKLMAVKTFLIFLFGFASIASAGTEEAREYIDTLGKEVLEVLQNTSEESKRLAALKEVFNDAIDTEKVGRFVLGKYWHQATDEQKEKFLVLYKDYLLLNYIPHFKNYSGETFEVTNVREEEDGDYYVKTTILRPSGAEPLEVNYRVLKNGKNALKIYDIIAEGVSAITTHRSEFASAISRNGLDSFIEKLEAHVNARR